MFDELEGMVVKVGAARKRMDRRILGSKGAESLRRYKKKTEDDPRRTRARKERRQHKARLKRRRAAESEGAEGKKRKISGYSVSLGSGK